MVKHFDHCTIVVRDVDRAKMFFGLLGFKEAMSVVIAGRYGLSQGAGPTQSSPCTSPSAGAFATAAACV